MRSSAERRVRKYTCGELVLYFCEGLKKFRRRNPPTNALCVTVYVCAFWNHNLLHDAYDSVSVGVGLSRCWMSDVDVWIRDVTARVPKSVVLPKLMLRCWCDVICFGNSVWCGGVWWCVVSAMWYAQVMVCGGMWWYLVVCGGRWWCVEVCAGMWLYAIVCGGMWWCVVLCDGMWWIVIVCGGMLWYVMSCGRIWWYIVVCGCMW